MHCIWCSAPVRLDLANATEEFSAYIAPPVVGSLCRFKNVRWGLMDGSWSYAAKGGIFGRPPLFSKLQSLNVALLSLTETAPPHMSHTTSAFVTRSAAKPPRGQLSRIGTAHEPPPASTSTAWPFVNSMFVNYTIAPGPMSNVRVRLPSITTPARPTTEYKLDRDVTANKRPR